MGPEDLSHSIAEPGPSAPRAEAVDQEDRLHYRVLRIDPRAMARRHHSVAVLVRDERLVVSREQPDRRGRVGVWPRRAREVVQHAALLVDKGTQRWRDALENRASLLVRIQVLRTAEEHLTRLAVADPGNAGWQRDLFISYAELGSVEESKENPKGAVAPYAEAAKIIRRLAPRDPSNETSARKKPFSA